MISNYKHKTKIEKVTLLDIKTDKLYLFNCKKNCIVYQQFQLGIFKTKHKIDVCFVSQKFISTNALRLKFCQNEQCVPHPEVEAFKGAIMI